MKDFRKYSLVCSTLLLCVILFSFLNNLKPKFREVEEDYKTHRAVNLSPVTNRDELSNVLLNNGYMADKKDADFVADTLVARLKKMDYPNLYHLQKRAYGQVPVLVADSLSVLVDDVKESKKRIGLSDGMPSDNELTSELDSISVMGKGSICVEVKDKDKEERACCDVPVRLISFYFDSIGQEAHDTLFAKTDAQGKAQFKGLDTAKGYSVLPIKRGYEYGAVKGIHQGRFEEDNYTYIFKQQEHRIQMLDNATLKQIKNDGTITVRTPAEYRATVVKWFVLVLLGWWLLCFVLVRRKKHFDPLIIAAAMFLTGFCVLMMFSIQNPLTEELRGVEMATGVLMGLAAVIAVQFIDFVKFYQNRYKLDFDIVMSVINWLFLPFKRKVAWLADTLTNHNPWYKKIVALLLLILCLPFGILNVLQLHRLSGWVEKFCKKVPKGFGWLLLALALTALLWTPLGKEIGGMKVNLDLKVIPVFQPSEIAKYLILLFVAAFFAQNADTIVEYSRPAKTDKQALEKLWDKVKTLIWVIAGLAVLMALYLILGDMGPGLVIGITFILLYSLVKSKVNLENLSEDDKWKRIFTCDFAMLIYGIISFAAFIIAGAVIGNALVFALLWFVAWIAFGLLRRKQFFETAFIMNMLVFVFVFGGQVIQKVPGMEGSDAAVRFEQRSRMCVNTWGKLDIEHAGTNAEAVSNTQVANGLWGIATGGLTGQGLGKGNPNLIPAFHTDMIMSSVGEQTGFFGMLFVLLVLALLLRRMIVVGYRVGHPFAFYFCAGVAIVTGVQFFIIVLGSSGMIPLTGVTVPFLSYGRVSMILNLLALGIVLSISQNIKQESTDEVQEQVRQHSVGGYNYPVSIVSWTFVVLALFSLCVWQYYGFWKRGNTLIHPAFVYSNEGTPLIEYNPRIALLAKEMWAGNIYDRNGILLATSDNDLLSDEAVLAKLKDCGLDNKMDSLAKAHDKRYYPFGEHLFFMLGDINNGLYFSYNEENPVGYMAEAQHLAYLRNYDNVMRDENGDAVKVKLVGKTKGRFIDGSKPDTIAYVIRDNKELIKFLKSGVEGRPLRKHNDKVKNGKFDLQLTLDAKLQKDLQDRIKEYVKSSSLKNNNLLRISVVVLDAENGDLLTSANYPLPDYKRLRGEDKAGHLSYSDNYTKDKDRNINKKWTAYTDRDLGLTYQTMPGSTAKVMSAMAGLDKLGVNKVQQDAIFPVYRYEVIDIGKNGSSKEPPMGNAHKAMVSMKEAIVKSSNCYFINLVNHFNCYNELEKIYAAVGISIGSWPDNKRAYTLHYAPSDALHSVVEHTRSEAVPLYEKYIQKRDAGEFVVNEDWKTMRKGEWMWAWGQGSIEASPLNMARVVSIVANGGKMPVTRYLLQTADKKKKEIKPEYVPVTSKSNAKELKSYMQAQAVEHGFASYIGGKTGTPERNWIDRHVKKYDKKHKCYKVASNTPKQPNDGWYIFYVETGNKQNPVLAVAVRMERINDKTSGAAMELAKSVVLESLIDNGYIKQ